MVDGQMVNFLGVGMGESVMVGVTQPGLQAVVVPNMFYKSGGTGNAAEGNAFALRLGGQRACLFREQRQRRSVYILGKEQRLIGTGVNFLHFNPSGYGRHVGRTLADDNKIGMQGAGGEVTQPAKGQQHIFGVRAGVIAQYERDFGLEPAVLKSIVQDNELEPGMVLFQLTDALNAVGMDGYRDIGELALDLQRLVAAVPDLIVGLYVTEALAVALITTRKYGYGHFVLVHAYNKLCMWGFSGAAYRDVAYGEYRKVKGLALEDVQVVALVPQPKDESVGPDQYASEEKEHGREFYKTEFYKGNNFLENTK